jgi:hypothetical protein
LVLLVVELNIGLALVLAKTGIRDCHAREGGHPVLAANLIAKASANTGSSAFADDDSAGL